MYLNKDWYDDKEILKFLKESKEFLTETASAQTRMKLARAARRTAKRRAVINKLRAKKRKLNPEKFYFAHKFKKWTNTQKQTFRDIQYDESRIVIPLYDFDNTLIGFQGRSLTPNSVKYITVMLSENAPKIYGLNTIQKDKTVYITEGPFDSTFIPNSIAMCGADADVSSFNFSGIVWIYDNEPRNAEIIERLSKAIDSGEKVVIWPSSIEQKDINDLVLAGLNPMDMIESNTYSGLEAKIKFNNWKKI